MGRVARLLRGGVRFEAAGAFTSGLLNLLAASGVRFWDAEPLDACTLRFTVRAGQAGRVEALAARAGCEARRLRLSGLPVAQRRLRRRRALLFCLLLSFLALGASSLFVWDLRVEGNEAVSTGEILRALEAAGVEPGAFWPAWSADAIRNRVLLALPELGWLGVTVSGSRAVVRVRERTPKPPVTDGRAPHDVVAAATGVVTEVRVYQGAAQVQPGDAVLAGELLVSGRVEDALGGSRLVHARADVAARTAYEITAAAPLTEQVYAGEGRARSRWALALGDGRLDLYRAAGPGEGRTVVSALPFSWEGVFTFPIALVREEILEYDIVSRARDPATVRARLEALLDEELARRLDGRGEVLSRSFTAAESGGLLYVTLRADCRENIAVETPMAP